MRGHVLEQSPVQPLGRWAVVLLVVLTSLLLAAQTQTATLSGRVTDQTGAVIPSVEVQVTNVATNVSTVRTTNSAGLYVVPNLAPGEYRVVVTHEGFQTVRQTGLILKVQEAATQDFQLNVGSASESVTVSAESAQVSTTPAVSTVVDQQFVQNLPMNGRSFQTLFQLTPGVVTAATNISSQGQFSVNGQRAASNYYMVDGVSANFGGASGAQLYQTAGGALPALSAQGGTNSLVSVDAMQEFRIQTSTYAPEFGRTPGAQVSIITRSGTNTFHGAAFDYVRNDILDANDWFANHNGLKKPAERQNDFGGVFGGPIIRNKTFFFFSYEGLRLRLPYALSSMVPDLASRQSAPAAIQPFLNSFPLPNGPAVGPAGPGLAFFNIGLSNPSDLDAYSIRIDHNVNDKIQVFGRFSDSTSSNAARGNNSDTAQSANNISYSNVTTRMTTLGMTAAVTNTLANDLHFNYSTNEAGSSGKIDNLGGAVAPSDAILFPQGAPFNQTNATVSINILTGRNTSWIVGKNVDNSNSQWNVIDNLSWVKGTHQIKFGVDYRGLNSGFGPRDYLALGYFLTVPNLVAGKPYLVAAQASQKGDASFRNLSFYVQDTWKATPRLTLTYGLRWDTDFSPSVGNGLNWLAAQNWSDLNSLSLAPAGADLYKTTFGNFAPRVGASYQLNGKEGHETVIRSGFGIFYDLASQEVGDAIGVSVPPFGINNITLGGTFPWTYAAYARPSLTFKPPYSNIELFNPNLRLPYTWQWNGSIEQALGNNQTFTLSYVGSAGERLLQQQFYTKINANFTNTHLLDNSSTSNYNALQAQFFRRLTHGLQVLANYTWSHSIDTGSSSSPGDNFSTGARTDPNANRGNSDFDVRHSFTAGLTYDIPKIPGNVVLRRVLGFWSIDNIIQARTASPLTVYDNNLAIGGTGVAVRPDLVPGVPIYLTGPQYPGGKALNKAAFKDPPVDASGQPTRQGNLARNSLTGFGASEWDFTLRRQFNFTERVNLQFRAEFFNILNHPNFGPPNTNLASATFGQSSSMLGRALGRGGSFSAGGALYNIGGPRSTQLSLRLSF